VTGPFRRIVFLLTLGLATASPSSAQRWAIEPYLGAYLPDDGVFERVDFDPEDFPRGFPLIVDFESGAGALFGARAILELRQAWSLEAAYGQAAYETRTTVEIGGTVEDPEATIRDTFDFAEQDVQLFYGAVLFDLLPESRIHPFVVAGGGGIRISTDLRIISDIPEDRFSGTDPLIVVGGGLRFDLGSRSRIRSELRDLVRFCSQDEGCARNRVLHNLEISGGVELAF
jgi:hypothetical protein